MALRYSFLCSTLFSFFILHFFPEDRMLLASLFLLFVCGLAGEDQASTSACGPDVMMREVLVQDNDDDSPPRVSPSLRASTPSGGLTEEQRKRMARQKEMALARRLAKENLSRIGLSSPSEPRILETLNYPPAMAYRNFERRVKAGQGDKLCEGGYQSPYFPGSGRSAKRESDVDQGWRSVRRRPVPGQSCGGDMSERLVNVEGGHGEASSEGLSDWKRECRKENEQIAVFPPSSSPKLEQQKPQQPRAGFQPSEQQMQVLNAIRNGKSVFLTGSGGTGKTQTLTYAIRLLKIIHRGDGVYVTASTGLAACALGGTTLHSFAGVGLGKGSKESLVEKAKSRREVRSRWINTKALILDEISMIDGEFFDKLDFVGRTVRNKSQPFGGIQLIVTGDFYQLPPVNPANPDKYFAFEAECWDRCFDLQIELKAVFRQSDEEFVGMLNKIRQGHCPPSVRQRLGNCSSPVDDDSGIIPTRLYPRKMDVGRENDQHLRALGQPTVVFIAKDEARNEFARKQLDSLRVDAVLSLSLGAQVMLAKNLETSVGLVNGARGVVVGFTSPDDPRTVEFQKTARSINPSGVWPLVRFACDKLERIVGPESWSVTEGDLEVAKRTQVPLLLAWALSVHKCQGMTLDRVETDLSRAFDYGMVYVALSRVKSLEGLRLIAFDPSRIRVHPKVTLFYDNLGQAKNGIKGSR